MLVVATAVWYVTRARPRPAPFTKPAVVNGLDLTVTYTGSECQDRSRLDIDESPDRVTITVITWIAAGSCNDIGVPYVLSGRLASELGARPMVDGACELTQFRGYPDCSTP